MVTSHGLAWPGRSMVAPAATKDGDAARMRLARDRVQPGALTPGRSRPPLQHMEWALHAAVNHRLGYLVNRLLATTGQWHTRSAICVQRLRWELYYHNFRTTQTVVEAPEGRLDRLQAIASGKPTPGDQIPQTSTISIFACFQNSCCGLIHRRLPAGPGQRRCAPMAPPAASKAGRKPASTQQQQDATLKTLCPEDKQKVAKLIKQVGRVGGAWHAILEGPGTRNATPALGVAPLAQVVELGQHNQKLKEALDAEGGDRDAAGKLRALQDCNKQVVQANAL